METRLLYLITDSGVGGTEKVLNSLLTGLDRRRFAPCAVLVLKKKREMAAVWEKSGVPVHAFGMGRIPSPWLIAKIKSAVHKYNPDIVHAFLYHSIQAARLVHKISPTFKLISSPRVNYKFAPPSALWIDRKLRDQDAMTVCESGAGKMSLITKMGYPDDKVKVAWNSVDGARYAFDAAGRERVRAEWGIAPAEILIGSIGRLHDQKGYDLLVKALGMLDGIRGTFKAVVVGEGREQDQLDADALRNSAPIRFVGQRTDVPAVLSAFDIYVQSSRYEGLSNALLEAMSVGRACLATAVDGTLDFAKDGVNLLLARPDSAEALALGLGTLIEKADLRAKLAANAKLTAAEFSVQRMIQGFEEAYEQSRSLS